MNQHSRNLIAAVGLLVLCAVNYVRGQEEKLYEQEPFDRITLQSNEVLNVVPIDIPNRRLPANPRPGEKIKVRLLSDQDQLFELEWGSIKKIELFEQRLLAAAAKFLRDKNFDEAFEYFAYLKRVYPNTPGLQAGMEQFLQAEAVSLFTKNEIERAWFLLDEIHSLNPRRPGLHSALARVLRRLFNDRLSQRDFSDARRIYAVVEERYGSQQKRLLNSWKKQLEGYGKKLLERGEQSFAAGDLRSAYLDSKQIMDLWPDTPGAQQLISKITAAYPLVLVAVSQTFTPEYGNPINYRAARRVRRLMHRHLFEIDGIGSEGGRYISPVCEHQISADGTSMELRFDATRNIGVSGLALARELRARTQASEPDYDPAFATVFDSAHVENVFDLKIRLQRPHLRMESLLTDQPLGDSPVIVPYLVEADQDRVIFKSNSKYVLAEPGQPLEIVERTFANSPEALAALRRGEIDVVARVFPADVIQARRDKSIRVDAYRVPSTHVLIPNYSRKAPSSRAYRAAVLYGIDREKILTRELLGGNELKGCRVISSPFSPGLDNDDPLGYAYNNRIQPRAYDATLARLRLEIARIEATNAAKKSGEEPPDLSKIVIHHPDDEIPNIACQQIASNLRGLGMEVDLQKLPLGESRPPHDNWDFLYADLTMSEPLADADQLLASDGFARCTSPYLNLAIRQLIQADNWNDAGKRLRAIHQINSDDTSVLPLWQIGDHFAFRPGLSGIGRQPVFLYQNIEKWRISSN